MLFLGVVQTVCFILNESSEIQNDIQDRGFQKGVFKEDFKGDLIQPKTRCLEIYKAHKFGFIL